MHNDFSRGVSLFLVLWIMLGNTCLAERFIKVDKIDGFDLEIGSTLPQKFLQKNKASQMIRISSEQTVPGYNVKRKGIEYKIGVDENNVIIFISSADPEFITPERIKAGMDFSEALKVSSNSSVILERGWIGYLPFKSGWNAAVLLDERDQWSYFDKVAFVFKRK